MKTVIKAGLVVNHNKVLKDVNILVEDEKIKSITKDSLDSLADRIIDARDLWVFPGAIDSHSHLNDPGLTESEDSYTGTCSAAAGGITTVLDHPLTVPITADKESFLDKKKEGEKKAVVDFALWAAALPNNMDKIVELAELGVIAFKSFLSYSTEIPSVSLGQLYNIMKIVNITGLPIGVHCENQEIIDAMEEPYRSKKDNEYVDYNLGRDPLAEIVAALEAIAIAKSTGARLHIVHTSMPEIVEEVWRARQEGYDITVETCPHYLVLTIDDINKLGPFGICAPPIRSKESVEGMWDKVLGKKVNLIGSDHATYTFKEKETPKSIWDIPLGLTGQQTMIPLIFSEGVIKRGMPPQLFAALTSSNTAKVFGIYPKKGYIGVGSDADLCFIDPKGKWIIKKEDLFYKMKWSPYMGMELSGKIIHAMVRGKLVFSEGEILTNPGSGKFIRPII
jgi:allantoinase